MLQISGMRNGEIIKILNSISCDEEIKGIRHFHGKIQKIFLVKGSLGEYIYKIKVKGRILRVSIGGITHSRDYKGTGIDCVLKHNLGNSEISVETF